MGKYGYHEDAIDLFRSYLSNRKQVVKCHNEISHISPAAKGSNPKISDIVFLSLDYSSLGCM